MKGRTILAALAGAASLGIGAAPATAASSTPAADGNRPVSICNYTNAPVMVAVAGDEDGHLVSAGWWQVENGACQTFQARYLRVHRRGDRSTNWTFSGETYLAKLCTTRAAFRIYHPDRATVCADVGGERIDFAAVPRGTGTLRRDLTFG